MLGLYVGALLVMTASFIGGLAFAISNGRRPSRAKSNWAHRLLMVASATPVLLSCIVGKPVQNDGQFSLTFGLMLLMMLLFPGFVVAGVERSYREKS